MKARGWIGAALVAALVLLALAGDRIAGYRFDAQDTAQALAAPSRAHWLGCDALGRDLLARVC
ncbi:MAG TPA: ABC transporter permease, partial [Myxococcota bacterium]|nr:ABC transporter permease [Myxococcota bacterium]